MYEFTNGIVVYDEKTRDRYIEAGYRLIKKLEDESVNGTSNKEPIGLDKHLNENTSNDGTIKKQSKKCNKLSK